MLRFFSKYVSIIQKIIVVIAVYIVILNLFFYFTAKDRSKFSPLQAKETNRKKIYAIVNDKELLKTPEGRLYVSYVKGVTCFTIGEACTNNPKDGDENFKHSILGFTASMVASPIPHPPASGVMWAYSGLQQIGIVPGAYAQGIGFYALNPIKEIWSMFRNLVFLLYVVVIVAIGFMIMFRMKINPQTVISIENSLPKIVISMILITFSFPIAGFMIDLMYVSLFFIINLFSSSPSFMEIITTTQASLANKMIFGTEPATHLFFPLVNLTYIGYLADSFVKILPATITNALSTILNGLFGYIIVGSIANFKGAATSQLGTKASGGLSKLLTTVKTIVRNMRGIQDVVQPVNVSGTVVISLISAALGIGLGVLTDMLMQRFILNLIFNIILVFSLFFIFLRMFFMILKAYVDIIVQIIFTPLILSLEAIPGRSTFSQWIKGLVINLATFPILVILILISQFIIGLPTDKTALWQPPFLYEIEPSAFSVIIGGLIMFSIPDLMKNIRQALGYKPMDLGVNVANFFAGATAAGGTGMGLLGQVSSLNLAMGAFRPGGLFGGKGGAKEPNQMEQWAAMQMAKEQKTQQPNTAATGSGHS